MDSIGQYDEEPLVDFEKGKPKSSKKLKKRFDIRHWTKQQKIIGILALALAVSIIGNISLFGLTLRFASKTTENETVVPVHHNDEVDDFPLGEYSNWDISQNHSKSIAFHTSEGTWLSVDISPDQTTLVFDMLGDIYTLAIGGGPAFILKGGVPFDRQPRYSPDGRYLLYTSDASGCDNVWIMEIASQNTWMVTNETYRFISNAMWSPDQKYIVATKWFTSERSIGAGEIWRYPIDFVGKRAQTGYKLVGRVSEQVGPEEPFHGSNYVYFSQNIADTNIWQYSKNPHSVIYAIFRINLSTNKTEAVATGYGGSCRPILSPNEQKLAFVRRVGFQSSLIIRDLTTGNEQIIFDELSLDQQETYAPHGIYPPFTWMSDNRRIIIWSNGKIYLIDSQTGSSSLIPFDASINIQIAPTVRSQIDPRSGDSFPAKSIAYISSDEKGSKLSYSIVGQSFVKDLVNGRISPIATFQSGVYEFGASISSDGKYIVHVLWTDESLSTVQIVRISDHRRFNVTTSPGRYTQPSFSPSNNKIVFNRVGGDSLSGEIFSQNTGIYVADLYFSGDNVIINSIKLVTTNGWQASFSSDGESLYVSRYWFPNIQLDKISISTGQIIKRIANSKYAQIIKISPDEKYIAFMEFLFIYVVPYNQSATSFSLSGRPKALTPGVQRVSMDGGYSIEWSRDSSKLFWTLGENFPNLFFIGKGSSLFSISMSEFSGCSPHCNIGELVKVEDLSVTVSTGIPQQTVVIDNCTILTMINDQLIEGGRIVIQGDTITDIGPMSSVNIPQNSLIIEAAGDFVMPGFIDVHAHWSWNRNDLKVVNSWEFLVNLAFGVTTLHNPSLPTLDAFIDIELVRSGRKIGSRMFSTGKVLYGAGGEDHCDIDTYEDALSAIKSCQTEDITGFVILDFGEIIREAARELGVNVVPEAGMSFHWNLNQIIDGHTTIEHSLPIPTLYRDVIQLFAQSGTAYTPTFIVSYGGIFGERYWFQHTNVWEDERLMSFAPKAAIEALTMRRVAAEDIDYNFIHNSQSARAIYEQGGVVQTGAHGEMQGLGFHWELWNFKLGNFTNFDVLKAGTINGARALGLNNYLGTLEPGKLADIIFYDRNENPLINISNSKKVKKVMKDGRIYDAATMDQIHPQYIPRSKFPVLNLQHV